MTKVCICQICTCGRHRCPHHPNNVVPKGNGQCLLTEYANKYKKHPLELRQSCKPTDKPLQSDQPLDDKTTQRVDYIPHPPNKPYQHQPDTYRKPEGDVDHLTTYVKDYPEKQGERAAPLKRNLTRKSPGKFEGEPTYKIDYRKWTPTANERKVPDAGYRPPSAPFQGNSHYQTDYHPHRVAPPQSLKPAEKPLASGAFDPTTGYKQEYVKHPMPPKYVKDRPVYERNTVPLDGLSNYMKDYIKKQAPLVASCKPDHAAYNSGAPIEKDTTHRVDYQKWPMEKPHMHQPEAWVKPDGNIDFGTTTHIDYDRKQGSPAKARRPIERKGIPGKFEGIPTYKTDYRKWETDGPLRPQRETEYVPPGAPFEGESTAKRDYIGYKEAPRRSMKPAEKAVTSGPFDDTTGYKVEYVKHPLQLKAPKERQKWNPNPATLDGLTNYLKDYTPKQAEKMASCKPDGGAYASDAPFDDKTTQRVDYKQWPTERPFQHQPDAYQKPDGEFDFGTTHTRDFTKKPLALTSARKPPSRKKEPGQFYDATTHKDDFRKWGPVDRMMPKQQPDYVPPEAAFEGMPTYKSDYIGYRAPPRKSMRPAENAAGSSAPFDGNTMYRTEYIPKEYEPCPAAVLDTTRAKYSYCEQDMSGHKWYQKMMTPPIVASPLANPGIQRGLTVA